MDRRDYLRRLGSLADELQEDLWPVRTGKITKTTETAYIAEMIQRFCERFSTAISDLAAEEVRIERLAENKDQLSFFGLEKPLRAVPEPEPKQDKKTLRDWWPRSIVAAVTSAVLTLIAVYSFDPWGSAPASSRKESAAFRSGPVREWRAATEEEMQAMAQEASDGSR